MRRARGAEHALDSFRIIERTVMGAIICNCCGRDLLTVLAGLADSEEKQHTVLEAGSTVSLKRDVVVWSPNKQTTNDKSITQMVDLIDELHSDLEEHLTLIISGSYPTDPATETRSKICKIISEMVNPQMQGTETIFLRGLSLAFFIDNAMIGLNSLNQLLRDGEVDEALITKLLNAARKMSLQDFKIDSMNASEILPLAHSTRVERAIQLYNLWKQT